MSITHIVSDVMCHMCTFLATRDFFVLGNVAQTWRAITRLPAASPPRIVVPPFLTSDAKWDVERIAHLRPQRLVVGQLVTQRDVESVSAIKSLSALHLRFLAYPFLGPLAQLPLLAELHIAVLPKFVANLDGLAVLPIHTLAVVGHGPTTFCSLHLAHLPPSLHTLRTNFIVCGHEPDLKTMHHCHRTNVPVTTPTAGKWPPALTALSAYMNNTGSIPPTLDEIHVRLGSRDAQTVQQIFAWPRPLRLLDLTLSKLLDLSAHLRTVDNKTPGATMRAAPVGPGRTLRVQVLRLQACDLTEKDLTAVLRLLDADMLQVLDIGDNLDVRVMPSLAAFTRLTSLALPGPATLGSLAAATAGGALTSLEICTFNGDRGNVPDFPTAACARLAHVQLPSVMIPRVCSGLLAQFARPLSLLPALTSLDLSKIQLDDCAPDEIGDVVRLHLGDRLFAMVRPGKMPACQAPQSAVAMAGQGPPMADSSWSPSTKPVSHESSSNQSGLAYSVGAGTSPINSTQRTDPGHSTACGSPPSLSPRPLPSPQPRPDTALPARPPYGLPSAPRTADKPPRVSSVLTCDLRLTDASCTRLVDLLRALVALLVCAWLLRAFRS